jgi:hypothetical protein
MAKKPIKRKKRKLPKAKLPAGVTEDEFGELRPKRSKKPSKRLLRQAMYDILDRAALAAKESIYAQEDARVFATLDAAFLTDEERHVIEKLKAKLKAAAADLLKQFEAKIDLEVGLLMTDFWAQRKTKRRGKPGVR